MINSGLPIYWWYEVGSIQQRQSSTANDKIYAMMGFILIIILAFLVLPSFIESLTEFIFFIGYLLVTNYIKIKRLVRRIRRKGKSKDE